MPEDRYAAGEFNVHSGHAARAAIKAIEAATPAIDWAAIARADAALADEAYRALGGRSRKAVAIIGAAFPTTTNSTLIAVKLFVASGGGR